MKFDGNSFSSIQSLVRWWLQNFETDTTQLCRDLVNMYWIITTWFLHHIWIMNKISLMKWSPQTRYTMKTTAWPWGCNLEASSIVPQGDLSNCRQNWQSYCQQWWQRCYVSMCDICIYVYVCIIQIISSLWCLVMYVPIACSKRDKITLLMHWSYISLASSRWYAIINWIITCNLSSKEILPYANLINLWSTQSLGTKSSETEWINFD